MVTRDISHPAAINSDNPFNWMLIVNVIEKKGAAGFEIWPFVKILQKKCLNSTIRDIQISACYSIMLQYQENKGKNQHFCGEYQYQTYFNKRIITNNHMF